MLALLLSDRFCCFGILIFVFNVFVFNRFLFSRFSFLLVSIIFLVSVLVCVNEFVIFLFFTIFVFVFVNKNHTALHSICIPPFLLSHFLPPPTLRPFLTQPPSTLPASTLLSTPLIPFSPLLYPSLKIKLESLGALQACPLWSRAERRLLKHFCTSSAQKIAPVGGHSTFDLLDISIHVLVILLPTCRAMFKKS